MISEYSSLITTKNTFSTEDVQSCKGTTQKCRTEGTVIEMNANPQKIALTMARRCMNAQDLAKAAGAPPQTINAVIRGRNVRPATLGKVARALGCDPLDLMDAGVNSNPQASTPEKYGGAQEAGLTITSHGTTFPVRLLVAKYCNGNLAIKLLFWNECFWDVWTVLTVNLLELCDTDCAYIDINNNGDEILAWLVKSGLAVPTGRSARSGYCNYPEYRFAPDVLKHLDPDGYAAYLAWRRGEDL